MEAYLSIKEVAELTGLTRDTLRYYERIGLIHAVGRDAGRRRRYHAADLEWIRFLMRLRETGMPIAAMQEYASLRREGDSSVPTRRAMLEAHLTGLLAQIEHLQELSGFVARKVEIYREMERIPQSTVKMKGRADHEQIRPATLRTRPRKTA